VSGDVGGGYRHAHEDFCGSGGGAGEGLRGVPGWEANAKLDLGSVGKAKGLREQVLVIDARQHRRRHFAHKLQSKWEQQNLATNNHS